MDWPWDPLFADIAVLVAPTVRGLGLARAVTLTTVHGILDAGRLPLYRYRADNHASARVAAAVSFAPVTSLALHRRSPV